MTLYRTYRPQLFIDLINQETVQLTLQRALFLGRISHAYLFSGPRGTGKTSAARIFARALVCTNPHKKSEGNVLTYEPCNTCTACLSILENQSPDFVEIDAASNRGIENIRQLREEVRYRPVQLTRKIYLIDEVHMLTGEAFNALLKTLEEPPEHCLFILATTEITKVPITVRSRCQLVRFERGSVKTIAKKLDSIVKAEKVEVEKGVTTLLAEHAEGGFRDAETLLESFITQFQPLTLEVTRVGLGILPTEIVEQLLSSALTGDQNTVGHLLSQHFSTTSGTLERVMTQIINRIRAELFAATTGKKRIIAPDSPTSLLVFSLDQFLTAYILQRSSPLPSLPLEIACYTICEKAEPQQLTHKTIAIKEPTPIPSTAPVIELTSEPVGDIRKAWKMMIEAISLENIVLAQALKQTVFHTAEAGVITILVRFKFHADKMNEKKNKGRIYDLIESFTGTGWDIEYLVNGSLPKDKPTKKLENSEADVVAVFGTIT